MITIIMSFFVVMFSIASGEAAKGKRTQQQQAAIESLQYRFGPKWKPFMSWSLMPGNSMLPGGGKGRGSPAPTPAVGDPGGTVRVLKSGKSADPRAGTGRPDRHRRHGLSSTRRPRSLSPGKTARSKRLPRSWPASRSRSRSWPRPRISRCRRAACSATAGNSATPAAARRPSLFTIVEDRARTVAVVGPAGQRPGEQGDAVFRGRRRPCGFISAPRCRRG